MPQIDPLIFVDVLGIIAFAISGFLVGTRNNLDILGVVIAASLTALGGGIVRDTILSVTPFAFKTLYPATALFVVIFLAFLFRIHRFDSIEKRWMFVISDTIGLVAFSTTGALLALHVGYNFFWSHHPQLHHRNGRRRHQRHPHQPSPSSTHKRLLWLHISHSFHTSTTLTCKQFFKPNNHHSSGNIFYRTQTCGV